MLVHHPLEYWGRATPRAVFARDSTREVTYAEAADAATALARAAVANGIGVGDRVAVLAANCVELMVAYYGVSWAGATIVPINPRLASDERRHVIQDSTARLLLTTTDVLSPSDLPEAGAPLVVSLRGEVVPEVVALEAFLDSGDDSVELPEVTTEDDALQIYTSGTTGRPKGAVITHRAAFGTFHRWQMQGLRLRSGEALYMAMPACLAAGLNTCLNVVLNGATIHLASSFDPAETVRFLDEVGGATALAPTMIQACLGVDGVADRSFERFRWLLYGAAPISAPVLRRAVEVLGCEFFQGFGQTESPPVSMLLPADHLEALAGSEAILRSVGRPQPGVEVRLVDADGNDVAPGSPGEVIVRSDAVMRCYWNDPEMSATTGRGGWHHTGDIASFDGGYLYVVDRVKDLVISGGYNVYPREVERVIEELDQVAMVAVIGVPDDRWGEGLKAVVVARPGAVIDEASVIGHCRSRLADYKAPKTVDLVDSLPLNANGKVQKTVLRDRYRA